MNRCSILSLLLAMFLIVGCRPTTVGTNLATSSRPVVENGVDGDAMEVFTRRILPIMNSPKPSSCAECHLSGVDLANYIRADQSETFAALRSAGLIDVSNPDDSKILTFIRRQPERTTLISDAVRREEFEAFRDWIRMAVADPELTALSDKDLAIGPTVPVELIRHARHDRVTRSFLENIWSEVGRCGACHDPTRNTQQVEEHGEEISWIVPNDPAATFEGMLANDLLNLESPEESLLLQKPTNQIEHGGGVKMVVGDRSYKQFRRFIDDYAATASELYRNASELPPETEEVSQVTEIWLKVEGLPVELDGLLMQVDLHRLIDDEPSSDRWATSDRQVFGAGGLWQHSLALIAPRESERASKLEEMKLAPGRYRARIYVDRTGKLSRGADVSLDSSDLIGEIDFESSWPVGYNSMTILHFSNRR